jgi:hypothetical protein
MSLWCFEFQLGTVSGTTKSWHCIAMSKQVAWASVGGYIAAHTLNPAVDQVKLFNEYRLADQPAETTSLGLKTMTYKEALELSKNK